MNERNTARMSVKQKTFLAITTACGIMLAGCAATPEGGSSYGAGKGMQEDAARDARDPGGENRMGIRVEGLRLSAAGYILDFRYRVVDPDKAAPLLDKKIRPYLLDEASGAQLAVPDTAKLGQLRTTRRNKAVPEGDCFIMFANPGRFVQAGSRMTLVMGDLRIGNITVE